MGNAESHNHQQINGDDDDHPEYDNNNTNDDPAMVRDDPFEGIETLGYRVLGVQPDSPAAQAGLVSFLDFLVGVNGQMLLGSGEHLEPGEEYDDVDLPAVLQASKGQELEFCEYSNIIIILLLAHCFLVCIACSNTHTNCMKLGDIQWSGT